MLILLLITLFNPIIAFADGWDAGKPSHQTLYVDTLTSKTDSSSVNVADNFFVTGDITTLGNVGIGTTNPPQYKLEVSGSIKGNTLCIGTDCKSAWPIGGSGTGWDTSGNNLYSTVSGNIGVGTNNPTWKFVINSSSYTVLRVNSEGSGNSGYSNLYLTTNGETNNAQIWEYSTTATEWGGPSSLNIYNAKGPITFHPNALKNAMVLDNSGNLGIGTTNPSARLEIGTPTEPSARAGAYINDVNYDMTQIAANGNLALRTTNPPTADMGGTITFGGMYLTNLGTKFAAIKGAKEDGVAGNYGGYLAFYSRTNGVPPAERMRISPNGNVGIGIINPTARLDIRAPEFWAGPNPAGLDNDRWFAALDGDGAKNDAGKIWMEYGPLAAPLIVLEDYDDPPRIEFRDTGTGAGTELSPEFSASIGLSRGLSNDFSIMGGNVGIGTINPGAKLSFANLNDGRDTTDGITWYNPAPLNYGIYRTAGPWSANDYQQLKLAWATGIILDPGTNYGYGKSYLDIVGDTKARGRISFGGAPYWQAGVGTGAASSNLNSISVDTIETLKGTDNALDGTLEVFYYNTGATMKILGNLQVTGTASKPGGGSWTDSSDIRLKKNVQPIENALDKMLDLKGVTYQWIEPARHSDMNGTYMGMIANEVEKVFPEWVGTDKNGYKTLGFIGFEALTVESIRELNETSNQLKKDNVELSQEVQTLKTEMNNLKSEIMELRDISKS